MTERGCTVADGLRLRTLADVVAHLGASGQVGLLDATEVCVRRPAAGRGSCPDAILEDWSVRTCPGRLRPQFRHPLTRDTPLRRSAMPTICASLADGLGHDFSHARLDLPKRVS